jgi:hypothetical protein
MVHFQAEIINNDPTSVRITGVDTDTGELDVPGTLLFRGSQRTVREIGPSAFEGKRFTKIFLPASVVVLGRRSFARNPQLVTVKYAPNSRMEVIGAEAFADCPNFREMCEGEAPSTVGGWFWGGLATVAALALIILKPKAH